MFHILPEGERIASFKAGRYRALRGPGIVFHSPFGGDYVRLRVGQIATVVSEREVIVGDRRMPARVESRGGSQMRIVGFDETTAPARPVVAQAEDDSPFRKPPVRPTNSSASARPTGARFWFGLVVVLGLAAVCLGGGLWALDRVWLQYSLGEQGQIAVGQVLRKETILRDPRHTVYEITYRFHVDGQTVTGTERADRTRFFHTKSGDVIRIRYLPDDPYRNRPEGYSLTASDWLGTAIGLGAGVFFLVVSAGMIVARVRGSERSPRR
jgi:hypothetical protein